MDSNGHVGFDTASTSCRRLERIELNRADCITEAELVNNVGASMVQVLPRYIFIALSSPRLNTFITDLKLGLERIKTRHGDEKKDRERKERRHVRKRK